jgi:predicted ATPase/DNA-binding SARP family transcriptional activator
MTSESVDITMLGPLQVTVDRAAVQIGAAKERALLAWLALRGSGGCTVSELVDVLWGEDPPRSARKAIQTYVSNLRRVLPAGLIVTTPVGYVLNVPGEGVDATRFEGLTEQGRHLLEAGNAAPAAQVLREALGLWRGTEVSDISDFPIGLAAASRLEELRRSAEEDLADARLELGEHEALVGDLQASVAAEPLRERRWAQLMVALYRGGRQADALRAYRRLEAYLLEELGIDPSAELASLERAILEQRPELSYVDRRATLPIHATTRGGVSRSSGLPSFISSFVGRGSEVEAIRLLLAAHRLVTLTGSGGSGKTRLAVAVARELAREGSAASFVGLESVEDARYVPAAFGEALGMPNPHAASAEAVVAFASSGMSGATHLLVVDNVEHVLEATTPLIADLLRSCENVQILATSREQLEVVGERVFLVPGLSVPAPDIDRGASGGLQTESVALFLERAQMNEASLDQGGLQMVTRICRAVDGIPLAIELAASAGSTVPLIELERRLGAYLKAGGERRGSAARHRTLAATMQWSFSSLDDLERRTLVALTVFAGSFSLDAARAVAGSESDDVAPALARLVRKSLVAPLGGPTGIERYQLLSVVRELAAEHLGTEDLLSSARRAHAAYFVAVAEDADRDVHGPHAPRRLQQVSAELMDLRAALRYSIAEGDLETGARLAGALRWFFGRLCLIEESQKWIGEVLGRRDELNAQLRVRVLIAAGTLAFTTGRLQGAPQLTDEAIREAEALGDESELATALSVRGTILAYTGHPSEALEAFAKAQPICRRIGDHYGLGWVLTETAVVMRRSGDLDNAKACLQEALDEFAGMSDVHSMIMPTLHLGLVAQQMGNLDDAQDSCREAVQLSRQISDRQLLHLSLCCAARVAIDRGDDDEGLMHIATALTELADAENVLALAIGIEGLAIIAAHRGCYRESVTFWAFGDATRTRSLLALSPDREEERMHSLAESKEALGVEIFDVAWQAGSRLARDDAVALRSILNSV